MKYIDFPIRSPFTKNIINIKLPANLTIEDLQLISRLVNTVGIGILGNTNVPNLFMDIPFNQIGNTVINILYMALPYKNSVEYRILIGMISAVKFLQQLIDRVGNDIMMDKNEYIRSILTYCFKYGPFFIESIKMKVKWFLLNNMKIYLNNELKIKRFYMLCFVLIDTVNNIETFLKSMSVPINERKDVINKWNDLKYTDKTFPYTTDNTGLLKKIKEISKTLGDKTKIPIIIVDNKKEQDTISTSQQPSSQITQHDIILKDDSTIAKKNKEELLKQNEAKIEDIIEDDGSVEAEQNKYILNADNVNDDEEEYIGTNDAGVDDDDDLGDDVDDDDDFGDDVGDDDDDNDGDDGEK